MIDALLIYPKLGSMDSMIVDLPLSILYAASDSIKRDYNIACIDLRIVGKDWVNEIEKYFKKGIRLVGVSVMTGQPLANARDISIYVKSKHPSTKVVWGGPHATVVPETIEEPYLDFIIRGYGSVALADLIKKIQDKDENYDSIKGLSYKKNGIAIHNQRSKNHELTHFKDIPYELIDVNNPSYARSYNKKRMFPIFSAIGCPYKCSFCVHPTIYREINGRKWIPYNDDEIIEHIKYVNARYGAEHIVFMDDTSFPDLLRMERIFKKIIENKLNISMEFRGARINEIAKMDDEFLDLLEAAGGKVLMAGIESGSDRVLRAIGKDITREQVNQVVEKIFYHQNITFHFNFIYGTPGETYDDLLKTKELAVSIVKKLPNAFFGFGGDWKPIPGTKLLEVAKRDYPEFKTPKTLQDWIAIDSADAKSKIVHPWYTRKFNRTIKVLQMASWVIDDKIIKVSKGNKSTVFRLMRILSRIYKHIAWFRLNNDFYNFVFEYSLWRVAVKILRCLPRRMFK